MEIAVETVKTIREVEKILPKKTIPKWLNWARPCLYWVLDRLSDYDDRKTRELIKTVTIDTDKLIDQIEEAYNEAKYWEMHSGSPGPRYILMGSAELDQLMYEVGKSPYMYDFSIPLQRFQGMELIVVPWMRGMVVLPDFETLKKGSE